MDKERIDRRRLIEGFFDLVRIDSPTFEEKAVVDYLIDRLSAIGFEIKVDDAGSKIGGQTGNLIATLEGDPDKPAVFFNGHLDTVDPARGIEPVEGNGIISSKGDTILGADDKAGAAAILEMAQVIAAERGTLGSVDLVFTVAEEKGLLGAKNLDWDLVVGRYGFVLDAAGPVGDITVRAPWQNTISAVFLGKAAHAGVNPEVGVSAVQAAASAVAAMRLGRRDRETTANIGLMSGGRAVNIVPDKAEIKGEARSLKLEKLERQTEHMIKVMEQTAESYGAQVRAEVHREYDGFNLSKSDKVIDWAAEACRKIGVKPVFVSTGGGSDTNVFNARDVPTVNLGVGYLDPHTTSESISVEALEQSAKLALAVVDIVANGPRS